MYSSLDIYYIKDIQNIINDYKEQMEKLEWEERVAIHKIKYKCPLFELKEISNKLWFKYGKELIYNHLLRDDFYINLDEHNLIPSQVKMKNKMIKTYVEMCFMY